MGRPYVTEIGELDDTYSWSLSASVDRLADSLLESAEHRMLAIGSGGSLTSAHFACLLHTLFTGRASQVFTPYELIGSTQALQDSSVLVCSAGGSNPDVIACAENAADRSPQQLFVITTRVDSPLERHLQARSWPSCYAYATPTRKDGFLATNSLLATLVLLARAYETAFKVTSCLPANLDDLLHPGISRAEFLKERNAAFSPLCQRDTFIVLHGANTKPAAADFESRFTEAALGCVQLADFRNFAHGRHHWLAVHGDTSSVLAFSSPGDREVADRTLSLIPKHVPRLHIGVGEGLDGTIAAICQSLFLAHVAGPLKNIDPGRPHVPMFGRKLYHLKAMPQSTASGMNLSSRAVTAIERKSGLSVVTLERRQELAHWAVSYAEFIQKLHDAKIEAIIFDYDGTLCGPQHRLEGPTDDVIDKLTALLKAGVTIAIATGRGKSVRETLQKRIRPAQLRKRVIVGYHNGVEISTLGDSQCPPDKSPLHESLENLAERLRASPLILQHADIQAKGRQITLELHRGASRSCIYEQVTRISREVSQPGVSVVTSLHSIDILAPGVSKQSLLRHLESIGITSVGSSVLCIGDRGRWPGNDADLLTHSLSLSVDQVSNDPMSCWNLSDRTQRFDSACLEYLDMITLGRNVARFNIKRLKP